MTNIESLSDRRDPVELQERRRLSPGAAQNPLRGSGRSTSAGGTIGRAGTEPVRRSESPK